MHMTNTFLNLKQFIFNSDSPTVPPKYVIGQSGLWKSGNYVITGHAHCMTVDAPPSFYSRPSQILSVFLGRAFDHKKFYKFFTIFTSMF